MSNYKRKSEMAYLFISLCLFLISKIAYWIPVTIVLFIFLFLLFTERKFIIKNELLPLLLLFILSLIMSIINVDSLNNRNILKDISYFIRPLVIIYCGAAITWKLNLTKNSLIKLVVYYSLFSAIYNFLNIAININEILRNFNFLTIRENMGSSDEIAMIGFSILLTTNNKTVFSLKSKIVMSLIFAANLIISFSRVKYITFFISYIILSFRRRKLTFKFVIKIIVLSIVLPTVIYSISKTNIFEPFINKLLYTFNEINNESNWNDYRTIVHNWRGYEMYQAKQQYASFTLFNKINGYGLGTLIPVLHSNLVGVPIEDGGIILLHNGFYTILIKSGLVGMFFYVLFHVLSLIKSYKKNDKYESKLLLTITLIHLLHTYIITGMFKSFYSLGLLLLWGALLRKDSANE